MLLAIPSIWAQGSLGGAGGGGFGGGRGSAGRSESELNDPNQEVPQQFRQSAEIGWPVAWQKRSAILSPGDRVEYKIKLAADEVLLAVASSTNFDPALEVLRDKASVAKNDDRREGDQSPFINFRAQAAGEYSLNVVSYSKSAGGQFTLQYFVLTRVDLGLDPSTRLQGRRLTVHRIALEKGKTYRVDYQRESFPASLETIIGPSGSWSDDFDLISPINSHYRESGAVFTALKTGDYLLRFSELGENAVFRMTEVPVYSLGTDATSSIKLARGGLAVLVTDVRAGVPFVSRLPTSLRVESRLISEPDENELTEGSSFRRFVSQEGTDEVTTYLFPQPGKWRQLVHNFEGVDREFNISSSTFIPAFDQGASISNRLAIGQAKAFLYKATVGEISQVGVSTEEFSPTLDLYSMQGQPVNSLVNPWGSKVSSELYFPTGGEYLVVLRCFGNGGSGKYTLTRKELPVRTLKLGASFVIPANSPTVDTAEIQLEANTDYEIVYGPDREEPCRVLTPDYTVTGQMRLLDRTVTTFRVAKSGRLRLWFPRSSIDQPFAIRKVVR